VCVLERGDRVAWCTRLCVSSSFHPQTDGQTKRVNQTLEADLRHFVSVTLNEWDLLLSRAEFAHNNAFHESIQATPFYLNHGHHPRTPMGGMRNDVYPDAAAFVERLQSSLTLARKLLIAAQQRQKAYADQHMIEKSYKIRDQVLLSTKYLNINHGEINRKLLPKWIGPFKVVQKVAPVSYELEMNPSWRVHPVFHVSLLEPYKSDGRIRPPPPPIELEGALEYEVEAIEKHRTTRTNVLKPPILSHGKVMVQNITHGSRRRTSRMLLKRLRRTGTGTLRNRLGLGRPLEPSV
jgi:hypothetical protein